MSRTGEQSNEPHNRRVPTADPRAQARSDRRHGIIFCGVVLVGASAVFAVLMLTSGSRSSAPAAQSVAMSGSMPGMDHGPAGMPVSSPSPTMAGDMPGMDHGSGGMPTSSPWPSMAGDMPGMDHGDGHGGSPAPAASADSPWNTHDDSGTGAHEHGSGDSPAKADDHGSGSMPGMDHGTAAAAAPDRPLAPVLGTFGGASSAIMFSAVFLRRKDRAQRQARQAARAARRTRK